MTIRWTRKDLLGLRELSADEINFVLETADAVEMERQLEVATRRVVRRQYLGQSIESVGNLLWIDEPLCFPVQRFSFIQLPLEFLATLDGAAHIGFDYRSR